MPIQELINETLKPQQNNTALKAWLSFAFDRGGALTLTHLENNETRDILTSRV